MSQQRRMDQITVGSEAPPNMIVDQLFAGVLPRRGIVFVLGAPKVGKSLFAIWLAACVATGQRLLEATGDQRRSYSDDFGLPKERGAALYVATEDKEIFHKRAGATLRYLTAHAPECIEQLPSGDLPIIRYPFGGLRYDCLPIVRSDIAARRDALEAAGYPTRVLIFDTLSASFDIGDENDNTEMQRLMLALREYSEQFDSLVVVVAHPKKSGRRQTGQVRGAGSITASADAILEVTKSTKSGRSCRRTVRIASIRDGACEGERFEFEIKTFDGEPAICPLAAPGGTSRTSNMASALTERHVRLLHHMEAWSATDGVVVEASSGHLVHAISLERMAQRAFDAEYPDGAGAETTNAARARDRVRKQVGRDGLNKLAKVGLLERYEVQSKPWFQPSTNWDEMTDTVATLAPRAGYTSAATLQREHINDFYAHPDRIGDAMSRALFRALTQAAIRIPQLPDSAQRSREQNGRSPLSQSELEGD